MEILVVSVIAADQNILIKSIIQLTAKHECIIKDSRMTLLGSNYAAIIAISGNWSAIAKLETALNSIQSEDLTLIVKRSKALDLSNDYLPYIAHVVALDSPGIIADICQFFNSQDILIADFQSNPFTAVYSDTSMSTFVMSISIPAALNLSDLRERFMILCDELNVDGILEPEKR